MLNALTIDIEDYFHVSNFEGYVQRNKWEVMPIRVEETVMKILELLSIYRMKATFFVLGWIAERMGSLIRRIRAEDHEIASHGYDHRLAYEMSPQEFRVDVRKSKTAIEDAIGERIYGYRASSYSIIRRNLWCLQILCEEGFLYDSSIFPVHHDRYGIPDWDRFPKIVHRDRYSIYEVPPSTFKIFGYNLPIAGGGYLRLLPVQILSYCISKINKAEGKPAIIYFHPWEIDRHQPRIKIPFSKAFRHYNNIHTTEKKVTYLLKSFKFTTVRETLDIRDSS